jgi:hypothetical protein
MELCRTMQQRGQCPPLLVVFDSREGYFLELMALTYLLFGNLNVHNSEFMVLRLKVAICAHAAGICVCATSLDVPVSHTQKNIQWHTHKIV